MFREALPRICFKIRVGEIFSDVVSNIKALFDNEIFALSRIREESGEAKEEQERI